MNSRAHDEHRDNVGSERTAPEAAHIALLDELGERLASHYRAVEEAEAARARRWPALSLPRPVPALLAGLMLLIAGAALAAVTLSSQRKTAVSGRAPSSAGAGASAVSLGELGTHYRLVFAPVLAAGSAGWKSFVDIDQHHHQATLAGGAGYPTAEMPLVAGEGGYLPPGPRDGQIIHYVLSGPEVATVKIGSKKIPTRSSPTLPAGDRLATFVLPAHKARSSPQQPQVARPGRTAASDAPTPIDVIPLDGSGTPIRARGFSAKTPRLPVRVWHAKPGVSPTATGAQPLLQEGACALRQRGLPALAARQAEVALRLRPVTNAVGELLLSCLQVTYELHGSHLRAAILLNARHPGREPPGPIPGARDLNGHPGTVNATLGSTPGNITARREGGAWLVVQGGHDLRQRLHVLHALRIAIGSLPDSRQR